MEPSQEDYDKLGENYKLFNMRSNDSLSNTFLIVSVIFFFECIRYGIQYSLLFINTLKNVSIICGIGGVIFYLYAIYLNIKVLNMRDKYYFKVVRRK